MAESKGLFNQLSEATKNNPAVDRLKGEATSFLQAKGHDLTKSIGGKLEGATGRLQEQANGGGVLAKGAAEGAKKAAKGENPIAGAVKGAAGGVKDKVKEKIPGLGSGGGGAGGKATKSTSIIEEIDVGAPVRMVYDQWTQLQEFSDFMKKVDGVEQAEETKVNFKAQVFWSHRSWEATIMEQVPDEMITWRSNGDKGHVDGTVTFHALAPRLTRVLVVLEYYPQGFFERTGNIWRAQGRRARLELKHFRRHVMMNVMHEPDDVEGWRGEIHDSEVARSHEDVVEEEEQQEEDRDRELYESEEEEEPEAEYDEDEEEPEAEYDEDEEEPEAEYDEDEEEPEAEYDEDEEDDEDDEYEDEEELEEEEEEEEPPRRRRSAARR